MEHQLKVFYPKKLNLFKSKIGRFIVSMDLIYKLYINYESVFGDVAKWPKDLQVKINKDFLRALVFYLIGGLLFTLWWFNLCHAKVNLVNLLLL